MTASRKPKATRNRCEFDYHSKDRCRSYKTRVFCTTRWYLCKTHTKECGYTNNDWDNAGSIQKRARGRGKA